MPHTRVVKHVWSRMLTSCTTSVTFVSRLLKDGRRRGFTSTFCGVQRSVLACGEVIRPVCRQVVLLSMFVKGQQSLGTEVYSSVGRSS